MPFLHGFRFQSIEWLGPNAIEVRLDPGAYVPVTGLPVVPRWQLYAGRRLIGISASEQPLIIGDVPAGAASPLSAIVCEATEAGEDFGHLLHRKPWNVYRVTWARVADSDCQLYEIVAGRNAGDDYDSTNVIARVPHTDATSYSYDLPPFPDRGDWELAVIARDNAVAGGNAGTPRVITIPALVYPPDFLLYENGNRFTADTVAGDLVVGFEYGSVSTYP